MKDENRKNKLNPFITLFNFFLTTIKYFSYQIKEVFGLFSSSQNVCFDKSVKGILYSISRALFILEEKIVSFPTHSLEGSNTVWNI